MTKRTKRYGGFLIGDRVRIKETRLSKFGEELLEGTVIQLKYGMVMIESIDSLNHVFRSWHSPNQLINLTRIEEEKKNIIPKPPISEKTAMELNNKVKKYIKILEYDPLKENEIDDFRLKLIKDFVNESLRQTEIFLSPLSPYGDPIPAPYTRKFYSTTNDY